MVDEPFLTRNPTGERCIDHAIRGKCSTREVDRVLAELAGRQHGVVARRQLLAVGVGRRAIEERLNRRLHPVHRGVYAVGHRALRIEGRWIAAVLSSGPDAVLSHRSAAQLWGLVPRASNVIEVARPRSFRPQPHVRAHRSALPEDERTAVLGIPVTIVPRTVLDLAAVASRQQVERALNEIEVQRLTHRLSIPDLLERYPRRRGSALLRALLAEGAEMVGVPRNKLEERFKALVDSRELPRPRFNADVAVNGRFFSADGLWGLERLIVELDGRAVHARRAAFEDDRERDRILVADGWRVVRITWRQLCDQPDEIAADLRRALARP